MGCGTRCWTPEPGITLRFITQATAPISIPSKGSGYASKLTSLATSSLESRRTHPASLPRADLPHERSRKSRLSVRFSEVIYERCSSPSYCLPSVFRGHGGHTMARVWGCLLESLRPHYPLQAARGRFTPRIVAVLHDGSFVHKSPSKNEAILQRRNRPRSRIRVRA